MTIPKLWLFCSSILFLGGTLGIDKRKILIDGNDENRLAFATRNDGSVIFHYCKSFLPKKQLDCVIYVVGLSGPEVAFPFTHKAYHNGPIYVKDISVDTIENVAYVLMSEVDLQGHDYAVALAIDLESGAVFRFNLPPGYPYKDDVISLIIDHNGANLILRDPAICGIHLPRCKLTFNRRGERLGEPVSFPIKDGLLKSFPRVVKSENRGVLVFQGLPNIRGRLEFTSVYIDFRGDTTISYHFASLPTVFFDTGDLYLACTANSSLPMDMNKIDCAQYDWKHNKTMALTLSSGDFGDKKNEAYFVSAASLDESKFLVATLECGKDHKSGCKSARVSSLNVDGQVLKAMQLFNDLECPTLSAFEGMAVVDVENQFCFHIIHHPASNLGRNISHIDHPELQPSQISPLFDQNSVVVQTKCIPKSDL
ncbi:hypothetical protein QAD02_004893 [Eretmocerus hayati]|uniref:Uncharacterized protein n=1 Tax=Eretmocerus hayati TaxID=131215 RepID=A0ACC2NSR1_9HYME|nr:hypothetical protein QAD02_004893 [Eretmocerus hayati]